MCIGRCVCKCWVPTRRAHAKMPCSATAHTRTESSSWPLSRPAPPRVSARGPTRDGRARLDARGRPRGERRRICPGRPSPLVARPARGGYSIARPGEERGRPGQRSTAPLGAHAGARAAGETTADQGEGLYEPQAARRWPTRAPHPRRLFPSLGSPRRSRVAVVVAGSPGALPRAQPLSQRSRPPPGRPPPVVPVARSSPIAPR